MVEGEEVGAQMQEEDVCGDEEFEAVNGGIGRPLKVLTDPKRPTEKLLLECRQMGSFGVQTLV